MNISDIDESQINKQIIMKGRIVEKKLSRSHLQKDHKNK